MFGWLIGRLTGPWLYPLILSGVGLLFFWGSAQTWRLHTAESAVAKAEEKTRTAEAMTEQVRDEWQAQVNKLQAESIAAEQAYRAKEQGYISQIQKGYNDVETLRAKNAAVMADLQRQLTSVRATLAAYAAGTSSGGRASDDTVAACEHRAGLLGDVLAEALRVDTELADDAEREAGNARGLLDSWPK